MPSFFFLSIHLVTHRGLESNLRVSLNAKGRVCRETLPADPAPSDFTIGWNAYDSDHTILGFTLESWF